MKVLVTGAGGYIGLNVVAALKDAGLEVHALVRETTRRDYLENLEVPIHVCDILDGGLERFFAGMDAVIHCAAVTSGFKKDRKIQPRVNITGTRNVVEAAAKHNIKRFVYTSSTSTIGSHGGDRPAGENVALQGFRAASQYGRTKLAAENIVLAAANLGMEVVLLNPAEVLGPYDYHFGWGSVIIGLKKGEIPFIPTGGGSFCHAADVAAAHLAALTKGRSGERYILGGVNILYRDLFREICKIAGCPLPQPNAFINSYHTLRLVFGMQEWLYPVTGKLPPLDKIRLKAFYTKLFYSSEKAKQELDFRISPIERMITDSYNWYCANGYL